MLPIRRPLSLPIAAALAAAGTFASCSVIAPLAIKGVLNVS